MCPYVCNHEPEVDSNSGKGRRKKKMIYHVRRHFVWIINQNCKKTFFTINCSGEKETQNRFLRIFGFLSPPPLKNTLNFQWDNCKAEKRPIKVNLCQKLLFLHQLTHNMTADCSLNYKRNTWKFQAQTWREHVVYRNCFWHSEQFLYTTCSHHVRQKEELLTKILVWPNF